MTKTALILGATGRIGRHAALAFRTAGWQVRDFDRKSDDLMQAAEGADVIVNGWNPPYSAWASTVPGLTRQVIAAAKPSGATVIIPGNVYVFGTEMPPMIGPQVPHRAQNPLGRVRRDLEHAYRQAGVKTIILRAGDFLDDHPSGNWFDMVIAKPAAKGRLNYPGNRDIPHAWAWLPDLARAMVGLAEKRAELPQFTDLAFPGYTLSGHHLAALAGQALGHSVKAKSMSWLPIQVARPFWKEAKHLLEMRYLWDTPHALDGSELQAILGEVPQTDPALAIRRALDHQIHPDKAVTGRRVAV